MVQQEKPITTEGEEDYSHKNRFALVTLGCKVNRVESDSFQAVLQQAGRIIVNPEDAECIVVNTCTVTAEADKKARKTIRTLLKNAPAAQVVVTGCAASVKPEMFTSLSKRIQVKDRMQLLEELKALGTEGTEENRTPLRIGEGFRTRVGLKIQDGCDNACSYCIVHVARGSARSVPVDQVVDEALNYLSYGVKELVLTGIDLGSYRCEEHDLSSLLKKLLASMDRLENSTGQVMRLRASSLEPMSISDELIGLLASSQGRLCRHLHLPLQSGSSKVLREMNRPYSSEEFMTLVEKLYAWVPELSLTTDIICGFPGESDADFEETLAIARQARFSKIHVFPYSKREGTPAAARNDQIDPLAISERAAQLRELASILRKEDRARRSGTTEFVLIQDKQGISESYHEIALNESYEQGSLLPLVLP